MKLLFTGTDTVRAYRGDGLYCIANKPATCAIEVPAEHACRLIREHPKWWDVPEESKNGMKTAMQKLLSRGKIDGTIRLRWIGTRAQRYYRGDRIYCDAEDEQTCIIYVNQKKAAQLLKDFPKMWINLDDVKIADMQKPQQPKVNLNTKSVVELKDIAAAKGIDISGVTGKSDIVNAIENPVIDELIPEKESEEGQEELETETVTETIDDMPESKPKRSWGRKKKKR